MPIRVAINGFGRIGRSTFKAAFGRLKNLQFVAINDLTDTSTLAHLLRYDTAYGKYDHEVDCDPTHLIVDGKKIRVYQERDPAKLPWKDEEIDVVLECTGVFRTEELAGLHITAGAKHVIISAPAKGGDVPTHVMGVNDGDELRTKITNNASCTTNCIAPVAQIISDSFGVERAIMTTIHGYTAEQNLQDGPHKDLRRARAAAANIIPTTTGAAKATAEVIPGFKGIFDGLAIRVPVPVVSLADLTFLLKKKVTVEEVNEVFRQAAESVRYKDILAVTDEPLVSSDFIGSEFSSIVDLGLTRVIEGDFLKVVAWYDNEWGYSMRLAEMAERIGRTIAK
ncbi:type I glyceraldehyde-3-phosphate dehydrogenase [Patescibacteria group bacterium]|nr:type I glyceraldehyde-3-phosphate dehydrogenase [Patescibacteria group bacterium]MBU1029400.1 type I glyceraldehyde-3-phosphate dehydrogenase [Patescibacteria group bacterium]MBU1915727.1 type I glyceraldehyde-3-phosphate dehydrogenase [Patescibacteria group bacterium]